ncbi:MAG: ribonuclease III [Ignavibacteria bacterium]|nr:ribonuclease III [Ignavibacteria bacterium]
MKNFFDFIYTGLFRFTPKEKLSNIRLEATNSNQFEIFRQERKKIIEKTLDIQIKNIKLFEEALIHRSYLHLLPKGEYNSNERLEFLGDTVLSLVVSEYLFNNNPNLPEGELTKIRSWLVNKHSLSVVARKLELDKLILVSFSTAKTLERSGESILSDALEALIAAIYLDSGLDVAKKFILEKLIPLLQKENVLQDKNYKSILMEKVQAKGKMAPTYEVLEEYGPPHDKTFFVGVYVDNVQVATGKGKSKKEAEQEAAKNALSNLEFLNGEENGKTNF